MSDLASRLRQAPIGVGCAYLTAGSPTRHEHRLIRAAFEAGARHFDVAPQYGLGTAERVLGTALAPMRDEVTITTKVGILRPSVPDFKLALRGLLGPLRKVIRGNTGGAALQSLSGASRNLDYSAEQIRHSLDESLSHLGTDRVDLYLLHMPRRGDVTEEVVATLQDVRSAGKALAIGLATERGETAAILADWPGVFDSVQYSWSALDPPLEVAADGSAFRLTHRAIAGAFGPISGLFKQNPNLRQRISAACATDLADPSMLSRALIGAALAENASGLTLLASRSIPRTRQNIADGIAPESPALGQRFLAALRAEPQLMEIAR